MHCIYLYFLLTIFFIFLWCLKVSCRSSLITILLPQVCLFFVLLHLKIYQFPSMLRGYFSWILVFSAWQWQATEHGLQGGFFSAVHRVFSSLYKSGVLFVHWLQDSFFLVEPGDTGLSSLWLRRVRQEDFKFKSCLCWRVSSKPDWAA